MVVIVVLGLMLVAVTLVNMFALDTSALDNFQRRAYSREANYQVARSALELGLALLRVDDAEVDGADDLWAAGPQEMIWEGRTLRIEIEDEERRFPVNALVPENLPPGQVFAPNEEQDALAKALARFLDRQGLAGQSATAALTDWMDPDNVPTAGGTESSIDPAVPVKNRRLDSFEELIYIRDWRSPGLPPPLPLLGGAASMFNQGDDVEAADQDTFANQESELSRANPSRWSDWLSLHSQGKININTAPKEILLCLDEQMSEGLVEEIIRRRQEGSLSSEEDLRALPMMDEDLLFRLGRLIRFNSEFFRLRIGVSSLPGPVRLEAVVLRDKRDPRVIRWEVY